MKIRLGSLMLVLFSLSLSAAAQSGGAPATSAAAFQVSSTTFTNGATLPLSMLYNNIVNGSNTCSLDGGPGGNQSPELSWTNAPPHTVSFVVTLYDTTAAFTHWGMYNIAATATIVRGPRAVPWLTEQGLPARLVKAGGAVMRLGAWPAEGDDLR